MTSSVSAGQVLHAVVATQGEYSDWTIWTVALYADRVTAERHAALAQAWQKKRRQAEDAALEGSGTFGDFDWSGSNPWDAVNGAGYWAFNREYSVAVEFVLHDPDRHVAEYQTLLDHAKEQGWVP